MAFGLTSNGFQLKRLVDIKEELGASFTEAFGSVNLTPESVIGQIIGIESRLLAEIWEQLENVYNSQYPNTAQGAALDNVVQLNGITRLPAVAANAVCQLQTDKKTQPTIPAGTLFALTGTDEQFSLQNTTQITETNAHRVIIEVLTDTEPSYTITIDGITVTGTGGSPSAIAADLKNEIDGDGTLGAKLITSVDGAELTITMQETDDAAESFSIDSIMGNAPTTEITDMELLETWTPALVKAENTKELDVPINAITTIINAVTGLTGVTNLSIGTSGTNTESDVELRTRRAQSLQTTSAATLEAIRTNILNNVGETTFVTVFENETDVEVDGRPPHSIELVVDGSRSSEWEQEIAEELFRVKGAGIQTTGDESKTVTDSNGDSQTVWFSYPTAVPIYIDIEYTKSSEENFPADGETQIENNVLDFFTDLKLGEDVLYQKLFTPIYNAGGVENITLKIDTSSPPTGTNNISIGTDEIAVTESAKITISEAP